MSYTIIVTLPAERTQSGSIELRDGSGAVVVPPQPALGLADSGEAALHGNPGRISTLPYGDTPTGIYGVDQIVDTPAGSRLGDARSPSGYLSYGREGVIVLLPTSGDAYGRQHVGLWIHNGDLNASGELRATWGCVRVGPGTITLLRDAIDVIGAVGALHK